MSLFGAGVCKIQSFIDQGPTMICGFCHICLFLKSAASGMFSHLGRAKNWSYSFSKALFLPFFFTLSFLILTLTLHRNTVYNILFCQFILHMKGRWPNFQECHVYHNSCRSNPWPNECLPRMKCALPTSVEHKVEAYCRTLSIPHWGSNLGLLSWQPSTLTTRLLETR